MTAATMFTIGYQGSSLEHLIDALAAADVSVLVDHPRDADEPAGRVPTQDAPGGARRGRH